MNALSHARLIAAVCTLANPTIEYGRKGGLGIDFTYVRTPSACTAQGREAEAKRVH